MTGGEVGLGVEIGKWKMQNAGKTIWNFEEINKDLKRKTFYKWRRISLKTL